MRPVLDGDFWMIGDNPDLSALGGEYILERECQECVDHHIFLANDGKWHLWGCVRGTPVGRVLYHWRADELTDTHWEQTGEMFRSSRNAGEDMCRFFNREWLQSPYIIKDNGIYYMFYGGHSTEWDAYGRAQDRTRDPMFISACMRGQICLMTSTDGLKWTRKSDRDGYSRIFTGPGESRDPMLLKIDDIWHLYYAGAVVTPEKKIIPQIYLRTSSNLLNWSDYTVVHYHMEITSPANKVHDVWTHEWFVVEHAGYYYLFRTENYGQQLTHVYRSEDPRDFGLSEDEAQSKYVGILPVAAPEIITDKDGAEYITSNHNLRGGTMLCGLRWETV